MKRHMAFVAAAALFATGTAAPALAAPSAHRSGMPDCIPIESGCMPVDSIGENTQIYIVQDPSGAVRGFTDFSGFAQWARGTYNVAFDNSGGFMHVNFAGNGHGNNNGNGGHGNGNGNNGHGNGNGNNGHGNGNNGQGNNNGHGNGNGNNGNGNGGHGSGNGTGTGDNNGHGHGDSDRRGDDNGGLVTGRATFATFYDRSTLNGPGFVLDPPNTIFDLKKQRKPGGGTWNNDISSFRAVGGNPGKPGVVLCAQAGCRTTGWIEVFNNGEELQLAGGLNNTASSVGVFSG